MPVSSRILTSSALRAGCLLALALGFLAGCAEERPAINRVQPYALKKALFVGEDLQGAQDDPEFYTQATLIDVGYGASQSGLFTSTYAQPMSRIKWQITEDMLLGRIAYERIEDSDGKGLGGPVQNGVIAVAFRITSHFDIVRAYNSTTGEQLNIYNENTTDRPWFEREHFRVDWSRNMAVDSYDFDTLSLLGVYGGIVYEPMAYDITDPQDPDAPVFDLENGYFDVTNKAFAKPQVLDLSSLGWGITAFPACFLPADFAGGTGPGASCNPVELTLRHSFKRVEQTDFEPQDWDGFRFQAYGAFNVERQGYTRNYRMTDDKWHRFITRYNLWQRSHYYKVPEVMGGPVECFTPETTPFGADPHRDENEDGTEDECEAVTEALGVGGSRCDEFSQKCTLPYQEREVRPLVWHYTDQSDPDYFESTRRSTIEWDVAMRVTIQATRYAECKATGGDPESCLQKHPVYFGQQDQNADAVNLTLEVLNCQRQGGSDCESRARDIAAKRGYEEAVIDIALMDPVVVLCHSPVEANDPELCGTERLPQGVNSFECRDAWKDPDSELAETCNALGKVRMGDLRYHQINVIETPQTPSPWGIYTDAEDPITGETISASINVWSWVNDAWSQGLIDKIRFIKGELTAEEITEGEYVEQWVEAARAAQGSGGILPQLSKADIDARIESIAGARLSAEQLAAAPPELHHQLHAVREQAQAIRTSTHAPSQFRAKYAARAQNAAGTAFEAELMTPMVQQLTGVVGMPLNSATLDHASLLRGANPSFLRDLRNLKESALAKHGTCVLHEAPAPMAVQGLADVLEAKFGKFNAEDDPQVQQDRAEKMRQYMARQAHYAVMIHEMGHSIGLRHNFVSSSDAFNYRPQYWQLRTRNGTVNEACTDLAADGKSCVGPRYFDPITENERDNMLWMFMHSSVMDYAGEPTQDFLGLGAYDFAAPKMFYGDTVAVYRDEKYKRGTGLAEGIAAKLDNFGGILGFQWQTTQEDSFHYTQLNDRFDLISNCKTIDPNDYKPSTWDEDADGEWHPTLDGRLVAIDGEYSRCEQPKVDYVRWQDMNAGERTFEVKGPFYDDDNRMRVPYGFGTDGWADTGNLSVYRHDNGADPYELFDFFITNQELNHIFDNYRRGRNGFSVRSAAYRTLGRFNEKMRDASKGLGLYRNIYRDLALNNGFDADGLWTFAANSFFPENIVAASISFDHFTRQLARPEHGEHFLQNGVLRSARDYTGQAGATVLNVPNGTTGYYDDIGIGGRPVENQLADDKGEFRSSYTINAGSYYEKMFTSMLLTESVDNFISASRTDFTDGRYRAVSMADLFPDGYRRWLGNMLTGDDFIKGPRVAASATGRPLTNVAGFPTRPLGWTSWWGSTPRVCFPDKRTTLCSSFNNEDRDDLGDSGVNNTAVVDPQVGWEQQKFLIAWTMMYLPENQQQDWLNRMRVWELGVDADPEFQNRIEFHDPAGKVYVAKTEGKEVIFGRTVQKGIAARVLEWANVLLAQAYEVTPGPDLDDDGEPEWWIPVLGADGTPIVKYDPNVQAILPNGGISPRGRDGCNAEDNSDCTCESNKACMQLKQYVEVPFFIRQTMDAYQLGGLRPRGIY